MLEPVAANQIVVPNLGFSALAGFLGLGAIAMGVAQRRGRSLRLRQQVIRTHQWGVTRLQRNAPFSLIPGGVFFLAGGVAFAQHWPRWVNDCLVLVALAALAVTCWFQWRPPVWAQPPWLRIEEKVGFPSLQETAPRGHGPLAWIRVALVLAVMTGLVAATIVVMLQAPR
jgi:hypothetical protein